MEPKIIVNIQLGGSDPDFKLFLSVCHNPFSLGLHV